MANTKSPARDTGGGGAAPNPDLPDGVEVAASLPDKLRVHVLAKLLSVSSREIVATLAELGVTVRGAQSSIDRTTALRVIEVLLPDPDPEPDAVIDDVELVTPDLVGTPGRDGDTTARSLAPMFNAPAPIFLPPSLGPVDRTGSGSDESAEDLAESESAPDPDTDPDTGIRRRRRRGRRGRGRGKGGDLNGESGAEPGPDAEADDDSARPADARGRGGSPGGAADPAESGEAGERFPDSRTESTENGAGASDEGPAEPVETGGRRRRRRRRRGGSDSLGDDDTALQDDDPPDTVVHVRDLRDRPVEDEVQAVRGSTRLEAKRQRRRDGREAGRRRAPILSEAEFLTRRESVARTMIVREEAEHTQIGVLEDDVLVEHFVTTSGSGSLVGNVYLGKVQNVLPSMEAAFVDIARGRNAVLYAGEVDWDAAGLEGKARRIEQALSSGDNVLVQVTKDPVGHKGARLTTQISLPGRFLVYVPGGRATGISRKLPDNERKRLKEVLKGIVPEDAGVIIRTASEGVSEEELARDVRRLQAQWEVIQNRSGLAGSAAGQKAKAPELLYEEPDLLVKVVRDLFTEDFRELVVQGDEAWDTVEGYVSHVAPDLTPRVRRYTGTGDVFAEYRIDEQITKALDRKVWLPSGGYLVIDRTEAMTVIDVNTGKFTGAGGNLEETVTRNNLEAAEEIIRQLRLRDIGGIIVIDFIDMVLESNRDLVLRRLTECLGRDRTRHQVAEVTSLGLVQMTRKRVGMGLLESHSTVCEHCKGRGLLVSAEPVNIRGTSSAAADPASRRGRTRVRGDGSVAAELPPAPEPASVSAPATAEAAPVEPVPMGPVPGGQGDAAGPDPVTAGASTEEPDNEVLTGADVNGGVAPEVPAQPIRTTPRRRRTATRPAGPPDTDQTETPASGATVTSSLPTSPMPDSALPNSAVSQAG